MTEDTTPVPSAQFYATLFVLAVTAMGATFFAAQSIGGSGFDEPPPFCTRHGRLENDPDRSGFTADDTMTFAPGATFQHYRFLGDVPVGRALAGRQGLPTRQRAARRHRNHFHTERLPTEKHRVTIFLQKPARAVHAATVLRTQNHPQHPTESLFGGDSPPTR